MDQAKAEKGKKVGADGLTKKERRALKVGGGANNANVKSIPTEPKDVTIKSTVAKQPRSKNIVAAAVKPPASKKICENQASIKQDGEKLQPSTNSQSDTKVNDTQVSNKELSKAELKAQRRPVQETQRLAKANAKNQPHVQQEKQKQDVVVKEKSEGGDGLSKVELKARRRAVQEAQRLAKANMKSEQIIKKQPVDKIAQQKPTEKKEISTEKRVYPKKDIAKGSNKHKVPLFNHLYFQKSEIASLRNDVTNNAGVHSAFLRLGVQYSSKTILGSNARCLALLSALKSLTVDFSTPPKQEFCRSLESTLQTCITYLQKCRPLAVSMTNALRHFKLYLTQIDTNLSDEEKRSTLLNHIDTYIYDDIKKAGEAISMQVREKISNGDIILTYGCSSLIRKILLDAFQEGKNFQVIVVDARPLLEGREMLRTLVCAGIQCSYILINAASFIMSRVTKVLLGAHALLANGYVMSRTGTSQVALMANAYKKPVLVCCETYKFCERVQTDSFVYNELGDPDKLVTIDTLEERSPLVNWQNINNLTLLNLMYDVTPPDLVTAVVTELAFLPCTSVPVILRIRPTEILT